VSQAGVKTWFGHFESQIGPVSHRIRQHRHLRNDGKQRSVEKPEEPGSRVIVNDFRGPCFFGEVGEVLESKYKSSDFLVKFCDTPGSLCNN
jgi:hypothetical protein